MSQPPLWLGLSCCQIRASAQVAGLWLVRKCGRCSSECSRGECREVGPQSPPAQAGFGFGAAGSSPISWGIWRSEAPGPTSTRHSRSVQPAKSPQLSRLLSDPMDSYSATGSSVRGILQGRLQVDGQCLPSSGDLPHAGI